MEELARRFRLRFPFRKGGRTAASLDPEAGSSVVNEPAGGCSDGIPALMPLLVCRDAGPAVRRPGAILVVPRLSAVLGLAYMAPMGIFELTLSGSRKGAPERPRRDFRLYWKCS